MPYKVYKKGAGYKVCKRGTQKCFSKKSLTKTKATKQMKAILANESEVQEEIEMFDKPTSVEGNVAIFDLGNGCEVRVGVKNADDDVSFTIDLGSEKKVSVSFVNPQDGEDIVKNLHNSPSCVSRLTVDDFENMGGLAIEAITGESPFVEEKEEFGIKEENLKFKSLFDKLING
jgi:hypothetical protein